MSVNRFANLPGNYRDMTQEELIDYIRNDPSVQRREIAGYDVVGAGEGAGPVIQYGDALGNTYTPASHQIDFHNAIGGYSTFLTDLIDPSYEGGQYGNYYGTYDDAGNLIRDSVQFRRGERHGGWLNENMEWIGPLLVSLASSGLGGGLFSGASQAALGELGINTALSASELVANQTMAELLRTGVTDAALGELGINTALSSTQLAANQSMAELLRTGVTDAALGELGVNTALSASELAANQSMAELLRTGVTDAALGELGINTALSSSELAANQAAANTLSSGITDAALGELGINTALSSSELAANQAAANTLNSGVTAASLGELGINTALTAEQLAANQVAANTLSTAGGVNAVQAATAANTAANAANTANNAANTLTLRDVASVTGLVNAVGSVLNSPIGGALAGGALGAAGANEGGIAPQGLQSLVPEANPMRRVETGARGTGGRGSVRHFDFIPQDAAAPAPVGAARVYGRNGVEYSSPEAARSVGETNFTLTRPDMDPTATLPENFGNDIRAHEDPSNPTGPTQTFARGGAINQGLGYLRSSHDGMADKIAATIDGTQPAKLSGGEFVIPADVVSHLGNGNSDAGAKQLHEFLSRVRKARTGSTKQGRQINPSKFMPK